MSNDHQQCYYERVSELQNLETRIVPSKSKRNKELQKISFIRKVVTIGSISWGLATMNC